MKHCGAFYFEIKINYLGNIMHKCIYSRDVVNRNVLRIIFEVILL